VAGDVANDTTANGVRTWDCNGRNGGTDASAANGNGCSKVIGCVAGWGPEETLDSDSVFVDCGSLSAAQCNAASQNACSILFQNQINNTGGCTSGQGGNTPSTAGDVNECVTYVKGTNANACQLKGRRCGSGGPGPCTVDGQPSGGNPANCCNGDSDGNGTCGTQATGACPTTYTQKQACSGTTLGSTTLTVGSTNTASADAFCSSRGATCCEYNVSSNGGPGKGNGTGPASWDVRATNGTALTAAGVRYHARCF
jgi:hypothetical protein